MSQSTSRIPAKAMLALCLASGLALAGCKKSEPDQRVTQGEPSAPSSEWVRPNPTEPAVPVTLPNTPMTNVPASPPTASPSGK